MSIRATRRRARGRASPTRAIRSSSSLARRCPRPRWPGLGASSSPSIAEIRFRRFAMNAPGSASTSARLAGLVAAGLGVCLPAIALACTCIVIPLETEIANTSHIFTAHKIGSHTAAPEYPDQHYEVLAVHAIWKGNVPAVVEVLL